MTQAPAESHSGIYSNGVCRGVPWLQVGAAPGPAARTIGQISDISSLPDRSQNAPRGQAGRAIAASRNPFQGNRTVRPLATAAV